MSCKPDICIICIWPFYPIEVGGGARTEGTLAREGQTSPTGWGLDKFDDDGDLYVPAGHAGVLIIKGGTGPTAAHYYEYGRYHVEGGNPTAQGNVRDYPILGLVLEENGWPTEENLHVAIREITRRSGRGTYCHGNVDHTCGRDSYVKATDFVDNFRNDPNQHYSLSTNSCLYFSYKVNVAGEWSWFGPVPYLDMLPAANIDYRPFQNTMSYNPDGDHFDEDIWQIPGS
ncbi:hypothetical protein [Jannaschia marina]|uniref:hypothetical protein n=1 Tax=Jannaschia marina TaxID=2741674 RepID=UPI0015CC15CB|nr:hypothetical protein [Jannaschia marina]